MSKVETVKPVKPMDAQLAASLVNLIGESMAIEEAELTPSASFRDDLNVDEIDIAELFMRAEEQYKLKEFSDEEWEACQTVGDFMRLVAERVPKKKK